MPASRQSTSCQFRRASAARDLRLQLLDGERLFRLEPLADLDRAEVFEKGAMDEGIGLPAHRAEHEVPPAELVDERARGAVGAHVGHAFQPLASVGSNWLRR